MPSVDASAAFLSEFPVSLVRAFQRRCLSRQQHGAAKDPPERLPIHEVLEVFATYVR